MQHICFITAILSYAVQIPYYSTVKFEDTTGHDALMCDIQTENSKFTAEGNIVMNSENETLRNEVYLYGYTSAVSPSLGDSRQHKENHKNNGGFALFF